MKRTFLSLLMTAILVISAIPVFAVSSGTGIGIDITPEEFPPLIWMCDERVVIEDCVEEGRKTDCTDGLIERIQNYAFEGEQIHWTVLVMDKNKIEEIEDVVGTIGSTQGEGNDIEVECAAVVGGPDPIPASCNARILEEELTDFDPDTMAYYDCLFTVETPDSMYDEYFITVEAIGSDGQSATMDENEFWFLNPVIAVSVDGDIVFENVRPGAVAYSDTILVGNDADEGSGVLLDMFISGTDFYDPDSSGAKCPDTNQLQLSNSIRSPSNIGTDGGAADADGGGPAGSGTDDSPAHNALDCEADTTGITGDVDSDHLCYFATNGAYSSAGADNADAEGYVPIVYGDEFTRDFYNDAEIIQEDAFGPFGSLNIGTFVGVPANYHNGNVLTPGAEIAMTFKLGLPEPCVGNFNTGDLFFWGEAI